MQYVAPVNLFQLLKYILICINFNTIIYKDIFSTSVELQCSTSIELQTDNVCVCDSLGKSRKGLIILKFDTLVDRMNTWGGFFIY